MLIGDQLGDIKVKNSVARLFVTNQTKEKTNKLHLFSSKKYKINKNERKKKESKVYVLTTG